MPSVHDDKNQHTAAIVKLLSEAQLIADQAGLQLIAAQIQEAIDSCKNV